MRGCCQLPNATLSYPDPPTCRVTMSIIMHSPPVHCFREEKQQGWKQDPLVPYTAVVLSRIGLYSKEQFLKVNSLFQMGLTKGCLSCLRGTCFQLLFFPWLCFSLQGEAGLVVFEGTAHQFCSLQREEWKTKAQDSLLIGRCSLNSICL